MKKLFLLSMGFLLSVAGLSYADGGCPVCEPTNPTATMPEETIDDSDDEDTEDTLFIEEEQTTQSQG